MAGFLDKDTRVVDMVLTGEGKYRLSRGELRFVYWSPFDVEVDYAPFISNSGSLTAAQLSASVDQQIENSPVREATTGFRRLDVSGSDTTNVRGPLFTVPVGHRVVPRMTASDGPTGSFDIEVKQQRVSELVLRRDPRGNVLERLGPTDRGFERFDAAVFSLGYSYGRDGFPADHVPDGFLVRVYRSGADGLTQVHERYDSENRLSFGGELELTLAVEVDDEDG